MAPLAERVWILGSHEGLDGSDGSVGDQQVQPPVVVEVKGGSAARDDLGQVRSATQRCRKREGHTTFGGAVAEPCGRGNRRPLFAAPGKKRSKAKDGSAVHGVAPSMRPIPERLG